MSAADPRIKTAIGPTILLQSGHYFDLLDPHGSEFTIEDIAQGLSMVCRFAGQCSAFYSVAEHSYHTSFLVDGPLRRAALMHDASEAFIGDVTRPLKSVLPEYRAIENAIEAAIVDRFDIHGAADPGVKAADIVMLHAEQAAMMPRHVDRWTTSPDDAPLPILFRHWTPRMARTVFLDRYVELSREIV